MGEEFSCLDMNQICCFKTSFRLSYCTWDIRDAAKKITLVINNILHRRLYYRGLIYAIKDWFHKDSIEFRSMEGSGYDLFDFESLINGERF